MLSLIYICLPQKQVNVCQLKQGFETCAIGWQAYAFLQSYVTCGLAYVSLTKVDMA